MRKDFSCHDVIIVWWSYKETKPLYFYGPCLSIMGFNRIHTRPGRIFYMRPTNERRRYNVTSSFIGWARAREISRDLAGTFKLRHQKLIKNHVKPKDTKEKTCHFAVNAVPAHGQNRYIPIPLLSTPFAVLPQIATRFAARNGVIWVSYRSISLNWYEWSVCKI